jgi:uncharacterized protein (DUF1015 family)
MPEIRPFRGWRYDPAVAGDPRTLIAPPYDVISPDQQRALYTRNPHNAIRLELTAAEPDDPPGAEGDSARHARARAMLDRWKADGVLRHDAEAAFYLYEQRFVYSGRSYVRRSLLVAARLYPWRAGEILPHEHTLAAPKAERLALLRATGANLSPIWSLFEDGDGRIGALLASAAQARPALDVEDEDGVDHALWPIADASTCEAMASAVARGPLYMADGHHRYETALAYQAEAPGDAARGYVLMALTAADDPGLIVLPTHRMLANISHDRLSALPDLLPGSFHVEELSLATDEREAVAGITDLLAVPGGAHVTHRFALLGPEPDRLRLLHLREGAAPVSTATPILAELDVWLAHSLILERCLGIDAGSLARQEHVTYTRDAGEAIRAVREGSRQMALFLAPTPVAQLLAVARSGAVMPQKSTYFYPKLATGLIFRLLG